MGSCRSSFYARALRGADTSAEGPEVGAFLSTAVSTPDTSVAMEGTDTPIVVTVRSARAAEHGNEKPGGDDGVGVLTGLTGHLSRRGRVLAKPEDDRDDPYAIFIKGYRRADGLIHLAHGEPSRPWGDPSHVVSI
mgnify:CR=1 FL=1